MALIFKSKLYRNEIKHWSLIVSLTATTILSSYFALNNKEKIILVGVTESESRIITDSSDRILKFELRNFIKDFLKTYYTYDNQNYLTQMEISSDLMTKDLFEKEKPKILELKNKLVTNSVDQRIEIENFDLLDDQNIEAIIKVLIQGKIDIKSVKLKVHLKFQKIPRSEQNPWGYEITEVSDVVI